MVYPKIVAILARWYPPAVGDNLTTNGFFFWPLPPEGEVGDIPPLARNRDMPIFFSENIRQM